MYSLSGNKDLLNFRRPFPFELLDSSGKLKTIGEGSLQKEAKTSSVTVHCKKIRD